ncbi:hypothetical protein K2173_025977 [Erythroxylum novogranatense]|uniref:tRNA/rRNA methyltransferase SpoU type domain-containing protein n=1 Tax=Erythroxylum novogranatense TaxID=1862640 RepID=A0AAV8TW66_9ROSI|nr:hypothetical protein K2173_025977 [Erythroxylum novogranatense]
MQSLYAPSLPTVSPPPLKPFSSIAKLSYYHEEEDQDDTDNRSELAKFSLPAHLKSITSTSNPFVKHCVKLSRSSPYRHSHASALVVGTTPIREIHKFQESLQERTIETDYLFLLDNAKVPEELEKSAKRTLRVSALVMKKLSQIQSTEAIEAIALMKFPTSYFLANSHQKDSDFCNWFPSRHRILVLEGIQDPGNLGTLLRSAVAFRWGGVLLLPGCCDPFSGKALRASRGASFQLPIVSGDWYHLEAIKKEFKMKMLAGHPECNDELKLVSQLSQGFAESLADVPLLLVLGNEGHGLSDKAQQECELVSIPMSGDFESLNVAVAGGIFLYMLQPQNGRTLS